METVVSMLLVTFVIGSTLATVGPVVEGSTYAERRLHAARLGDELMSEVLSQAYKDPDEDTDSIGRDSGEGSGDRTAFDDVDDYSGYTGWPAKRRDGSVAGGSEKYGQLVNVNWIDPLTLGTSGTDTGLKSVQVLIYYNNSIYFRGFAVVSEDNPRDVN